MNSPLRNTLRRRAALGAIGGAILVAAGAGYFTGPAPVSAAEGAVIIPAPALDQTNPSDGLETAIFAGGCFWGVQGVFQHVIGVDSAVSGYAGGTTVDPSYKDVLTETTGHAESVQVTFDPKQVTYGKLLQIFFSVIHDPTTLNYQGNDHGPSYRSALFTLGDEQKAVAEAYIDQLDATGKFPAKIVTEVTPFTNFFAAEDYHQDNATTLNVNAGYVRYWDLPKIANLQAVFPEVWREEPKLVFAANAAS
jgi:peptide-methionine (S)-S-oxide reductase